MITIGNAPPPSRATPRTGATDTVAEPSSVPTAANNKKRRDGQEDPKEKSSTPPDDAGAEELSDDLLIKMVRGLNGQRGVVVDKKV